MIYLTIFHSSFKISRLVLEYPWNRILVKLMWDNLEYFQDKVYCGGTTKKDRLIIGKV